MNALQIWGRKDSTRMPQKWLMCLLTLLLCLGSTGKVWAEDWSIDFATIGNNNSLTDKYGATISAAVSDGMGTVTLGEALNSNFGIQTGTSWIYRTGTKGLYLADGGNRNFGVFNAKKGQYITINIDKVPTPTNATLKSTDGNVKVYQANDDGTVKFNVERYATIYSIAVSTPSFTVTHSVVNSPAEPGFSVINTSDGNATVTSGSTVKAGDVLKISAYDYDNNMFIKEWKINDVSNTTNIPTSGIAWYHQSVSFTYTVMADVDIKAVFETCFQISTTIPDGATKSYSIETLNSNESAGMHEGTPVTVTVTPPTGKVLDKWKVELLDGTTTCYTNDTWSVSNPLTITMNYSQFTSRTADGHKIVLTPSFIDVFDDSSIGVAAKNTSWVTGVGEGKSSNKYSLISGNEYTFEFDCNQGTSHDAWNSWVVMGCNGSINDTKFILRPDSWVFDTDTNSDSNVTAGDQGHSNPTLALKDGALNWEQFKSDLDGAHVKVKVSYDGNTVFVYQVITNNGRTYTYYYPYTYSASSIDLYIGVDQTQLTNFTKSVVPAHKVSTVVRDMNNNVNNAMGKIVITNTEGVTILEGSVVGEGTPVYFTATANEGYLFDHWGNGVVHPFRDDITMGTSDLTMYGSFRPLSDYETTWTLKTTTSQIHFSDGTEWTKNLGNSTFDCEPLLDGKLFDGAYLADGTEMPTTAGLLFNDGIRLSKQNDVGILMWANQNGSVKIPVEEGEIVTITLTCQSGIRSLPLINSNGVVSYPQAQNGVYSDIQIRAAQDGYVELQNPNDRNVVISSIKKSFVYDFTFADGLQVGAQKGTVGYINAIAPVNDIIPLVDNATYYWTSSNPADVAIEAYTGAITVNESFNGNVTITATRFPKDGYPALAKSYTLMVGDYTIAFANKRVEQNLSANGSVVYWQKPTITPAETDLDLKYSIVSTTAQSATITQDETTGEYAVNVIGGGETVIKAASGAISDTYILTSVGIYFGDFAPVLRHDGSTALPTTYYQNYLGNAGSNVTWSILNGENVGVTADISNDGHLTNISGSGILVVEARTATNSVAQYCLTVPKDVDTNGYAKWNFYKETTEGTSPIEFGSMANIGSGQVLGSAAQVKMIDGDLDYTIDPVLDSEKSNSRLLNMLKRRRTWLNLQADNTTSQMYKTWNYTFKTFQRDKIDRVYYAKYTNEELFSYGNVVNGDNGRIIKNTAGLIFKASKDKWGVNDAQDATGSSDHRGTDVARTAKKDREMDRSVLMCAGTTMTIPEVKKDRYIRILWYRHSDNAGDRFCVENGIDLDGKKIVSTDVLRFTGSVYGSEYTGYTIFRVGNPDDVKDYYDVKITAAVNGWTEIYQVEILDDYETDFQICQAKVVNKLDTWDNVTRDLTVNSVDNARDINLPVWYNSNNGSEEKYGVDFRDDWKYASRLVSRIQTNAKGRGLIKAAPSFYVMGHPGQNNGWSGWLNLTLAAETIEGTATCDFETNSALNKNNVEHMIPNEQIRIGHDLNYTLPHLTGVKGVGTMKLVFRTHSGSQHTDEPHYTLNKTEAWVAVGEYSVQEYPYTWDFTKYNMDRDNAYNAGKTLDGFDIDWVNVKNNYGWWTEKKMEASQAQTENGVNYIGANPLKSTMEPRHKRYFAQGSQLALGTMSSMHTILESEGLRINIPSVDDANDQKVVWSGTYVEPAAGNGNLNVNNSLHMQEGNAKPRKAPALNPNSGWTNTSLTVNGTITVPEVYKGMYVFVRSASKPTSVTGATDMNDAAPINTVTDNFTKTAATVTMKKDQMIQTGDMKTWVYKVEEENANYDLKYIDITNGDEADPATQTADNFKYVSDVVITPAADCKIEGIGVTDEFKMMTNGNGWATDSRPSHIDYSETAHFTKSDLQAYIATATDYSAETDERELGGEGCPDNTHTSNPTWHDEEEGWLHIIPVNVVEKQGATEAKRGLILEDKANTANKSIFNNERRLIPLFVPACNIADDDISGNMIQDNITEGTVQPSDATTLKYVFTNKYYKYDKNNPNAALGDATVVDDYSYYIVRQQGRLRANSSYLAVAKPANATEAKQLYMFLSMPVEDEEATAIEDVIVNNESVTPTGIYTLSGVKLDGMPTKRGIYIMDGKKVYVK